MTLQMPGFYRPPLGLPLNWQDETTGVLPGAVWAFINHCADNRAPAPTPEQLALVIDYIRHHINAPCWDFPDHVYAEELAALRRRARTLATLSDVRAFISSALEIGLDPL